MFSLKRNSGLDFQDKPVDGPKVYEQHIDLNANNGKVHLQRNKTERLRTQALFRGTTLKKGADQVATQRRNIAQKFQLWMINEGGKRLFFGVWILLHVLVFGLGIVHYQLKDNLTTARKMFGLGFTIARSAALVLHVDVALILLPICRNFISLLRRTPMNSFIPFDKNIEFHKATGWSIVFFSAVHVIAHFVNFANLAMLDPASNTAGKRIMMWLSANFTTGPGATGWVMNIALGVMVYFAAEKQRKVHFERFWYSHHLFIIFFIMWQLHGMFCMIQPDRPPFCSSNQIGVFWRYWLVGGVIFIYERILREVRSRHRTYISKVIQHPSKVIEIQIKKDHIETRSGQYIFINCPDVSYFQWHPFTLTSAPEEDYISIHMRIVGDFTTEFAKALGCDVEGPKTNEKETKVVGTQANPPLNRVLPRVMVDGPFGSASEDFLKYETVILVGAGIGVTPFASILKSIWYRMNNFGNAKPTRLSKVYFTWVIRDFGSAEWFHSLLHAIEEQDTLNRIEINIYLTAKLKEDEMTNIIVSDVGAEKDAITSLRAPTHFGRPNWNAIFPALVDKHPKTDVGVMFCGPPPVGRDLHTACNKYSEPNGTRFFFGKENF